VAPAEAGGVGTQELTVENVAAHNQHGRPATVPVLPWAFYRLS
jgi:hypothetical protein